jgi:hypothetical protein
MARLDKVDGRWVNLDKPGGQVVFVGGGTPAVNGVGASDTYKGVRPEEPKSTISSAHSATKSGRGDTIVILPGTVTLTSSHTISNDDITVSGMGGESPIKPSAITVTLGSTGDGFAVTGANVVFEDLHFNASGAANTSRINAGAAGLVVRDCTFQCGGSDLETITIPAAGLHTTIIRNRFVITANGPDAAIEIEAAGAHHITITDNLFLAQNQPNQFDTGAINSTVAHLDCYVARNVCTDGPAFIFSAAATGMISNNVMGSGTLGSMLDPGSCMCHENYEADAINQTARDFPDTVAS